MSNARSLFNKPAWAAQPQASPTTDPSPAADLFTRSTLSYEETLKQKERQRQRKRDRARKEKEQQQQEERRRSEREEDDEDRAESSVRKKPRISEEDYARFGLVSPTKRAAADAADEDEDEAEAEVPFRSQKEQQRPSDEGKAAITKQITRNERRPATKEVVTLSSDDEDEAPHPASPGRPTSPPPMDSDEEFPALAALARERRAMQEAEAREAQRANGRAGSGSKSATPKMTPVEANEFDPVVTVLITSPIVGTKPLLVHRRLSQRFQEIREVWCQRQGFTPDQTSAVFLVYKMRRLYDVTTCKSLGIKVDSNGKLIPAGSDGMHFRERFPGADGGVDGSAEDAGKIHVVAVDDSAFRAMKREREEERRRETSRGGMDDGAGDEPPAVEEKKDEGVKVRILLKAKDYKLIVRPTTNFQRIITAFKKENKLDDSFEVVLTFDGERLEPEDDVQSTELEDMDAIEVHVR